MILFKEEHDEVNIIHLIMGNETDFQLNMSGNIVLDLTENINPNKQNILYINKCDSEVELQKKIIHYQTKFKVEGIIANEHEPDDKDTNLKRKSSQVPDDFKGTKHGKFVKDIKCPKCSNWGVFVKDGVIGTCDVCRRIEEGLLSKDIPDIPEESERDGIVSKFFKKKQNRQNQENE